LKVEEKIHYGTLFSLKVVSRNQERTTCRNKSYDTVDWIFDLLADGNTIHTYSRVEIDITEKEKIFRDKSLLVVNDDGFINIKKSSHIRKRDDS